MVIISKSAINQFIERHPKSRQALLDWYLKTKESGWSSLVDIKRLFRTADYVRNDLYVFNIGGNKYRLIARIVFKVRTVYIRFIGTHEEYDKVKLSDL
jgi:mRNA interferase HigB